MRPLLAAVLALAPLALTLPAAAQTEIAAGENTVIVIEPPKTKLERLQEQPGAVVLKRYSIVGDVQGQYRTAVTIAAWRLTTGPDSSPVFGISLDANEAGDITRDRRAFIDDEEIAPLAAAIDQLSDFTADDRDFTEFQASFRTVGGLLVSTYSSRDLQGGLGAVLEVGHTNCLRVYLTISQLKQLGQLIAEARKTLDASR